MRQYGVDAADCANPQCPFWRAQQLCGNARGTASHFQTIMEGTDMKRAKMIAFSGTLFGSIALSPPVLADTTKAVSISVMTYNVNGLPWPLASGRTAAFGQIENRLRSMRASGTQPHVIVLQEAFTASAKQIAANSGYRFIVDGPTRDMRSVVRPTSGDRAFAQNASLSKGEKSGKYLDSGLQIASDYPIVSVKRSAFPAFACAGYDCLANKGVMLVTIKMPGNAQPITIATTHMNSKRASGVSQARSLYAYQRQVDFINGFIANHRNPRVPIIFAGDFNASNVQRRRYLFERGTASWAIQAANPVESALDRCLQATPPCTVKIPPIANFVRQRARDWQFYIPGMTGSIAAIGVTVPFGLERTGNMLSDHVGYGITYQFSMNRSPSH